LFAERFRPAALDVVLLALRQSDWAQPDAYAIKQKRRAITQEERADADADEVDVRFEA
jgi:hypothetical protein